MIDDRIFYDCEGDVMKIEFMLSDTHVEELVKKACEQIVNKYVPYNIENEIRKKINVNVDSIVKTAIEDAGLHDYIEEKLNDNVYETIDEVLDGRRNYRARELVGNAIRDVIYEEKDKIVETVTERATEEISKKACTKLLKNLMGEIKA